MLFNKIYYSLKPAIPRSARIAVRRRWAAARRAASHDIWPIDEAAGAAPPAWPGWPDGKQFAVVLTHDVEGTKGLGRIERLMALEQRFGFRSSFNIVPEGEYEASDRLIQAIGQSGFEVGVHGLEHDGKLYNSKAGFELKANRINSYVRRWGAEGFRSPLMQHRLGWLHLLNVEYDSSTFDTDPFEPEPDGVKTIFPFWVPGPDGTGFVELPYTLAQDFTLFVVLREKSINLWKEKLDWIAQQGGMALLNTHPDYMCFEGDRSQGDEFPVAFYEELLAYVRDKYHDKAWVALPRDVSRYYRTIVPGVIRNTRTRVCIITHSDYSSDKRVRRYAESLASRGDLVRVMALPSSSWKGVYELNHMSVHQASPIADIEGQERKPIWRMLFFMYGSFVFLTRQHKTRKYDVIHFNNVPGFFVFAALLQKWNGTKIIWDICDDVPALASGDSDPGGHVGYVKAFSILDRLYAGFADHMIVSNYLGQRRLIRRSAFSEKCSVLSNSVKCDVPFRENRGGAGGKVILSFFDSLQPHTGQELAIKAMARLKERAPNCKLYVYEKDSEDPGSRNELDRLISGLGLDGRIRFFGGVSHDQIPLVIANADIGLVCEKTDTFDEEAHKARIMEFTSRGIPVVASLSSIDSYHLSDKAVHFFKPGDDQAVAEALLKVIVESEPFEVLSRDEFHPALRSGWCSKNGEYPALVDCLLAEKFELSDLAENGGPATLDRPVSRRRD